MSDVIDLPAKAEAKTPQQIAFERLHAVEHAISELSILPSAVLAGLRFERPDQTQVGTNWCIRKYRKELQGIMDRVELARVRQSRNLPSEMETV